MTDKRVVSESRTDLSFPDILHSLFHCGMESDPELFERLRMEGANLLRLFTEKNIGSADIPRNVQDALPAFEDVLTLGLNALVQIMYSQNAMRSRCSANMAAENLISLEKTVNMALQKQTILKNEPLHRIYDQGCALLSSPISVTVVRGQHFLDDLQEKIAPFEKHKQLMSLLQTYIQKEHPDWRNPPRFRLEDYELSLVDPVLRRLIMEKLFGEHIHGMTRKPFFHRNLLLIYRAMLQFADTGGETPWDGINPISVLFPWSRSMMPKDRSALFRLLQEVREELKNACASPTVCREVLWMFDDETHGHAFASIFWGKITSLDDSDPYEQSFIDYDMVTGGDSWPVEIVEDGFMSVFLWMMGTGQNVERLKEMMGRDHDGIGYEAVLASLLHEAVAGMSEDAIWDADRIERFLLLESPPNKMARKEWKYRAQQLFSLWKTGRHDLKNMVFALLQETW